MMRTDGGTTNAVLLERVSDWEDRRAWNEFFGTYDPLIGLWCGRYGFDGATFEDLCQQIWVELADRMRSYQYDPGKTFRGWLRRWLFLDSGVVKRPPSDGAGYRCRELRPRGT